MRRFPLVFLLALTTVGTLRAAAPAPGEDDAYANIAVFTRALQMIRQDYVDEKKTTYRALVYAALRGMFESLDPHSQFLEPRELKRMEEDAKSEFGGLGINVTARDGTLAIVSPMEDSPGFKAGLLPGDLILKIDGQSTEKMSINTAVDHMRGTPGESVTLTVERPATGEIRDYTIQRAIIKDGTVKDAKLLPSPDADGVKIGYVRLTMFSEPTASDLGVRLDELEKKGMQALILDLRYNPGGLLDSAVDVCGQFLPGNTLVVYTEGRLPSQKREYRTSSRTKSRPRYPIAVLVNGGSASASEIVSGALKDLRRAILVGETTFGKGSVQNVVSLPDNSGVRLTTAKYYTPGKQVIHEKGIAPNIRATLTPLQERLLYLQRRINENGNSNENSEEKKALVNFRDPQLDRAVDALKGTLLYGTTAESATSKEK